MDLQRMSRGNYYNVFNMVFYVFLFFVHSVTKKYNWRKCILRTGNWYDLQSTNMVMKSEAYHVDHNKWWHNVLKIETDEI